jgi:hypothetical protein
MWIMHCKSRKVSRRKNREFSFDPEIQRLIVESAFSQCDDGRMSAELEARWNDLLDLALQGFDGVNRCILIHYLDESVQRTLDEIATACGCSRAMVEITIEQFQDRLMDLLRRELPDHLD